MRSDMICKRQVVHCMKVHWGSSMVEWEKLADEEVSKAKILELQKLTCISDPLDDKLWRCAHCRHQAREPERMRMDRLLSHLVNV